MIASPFAALSASAKLVFSASTVSKGLTTLAITDSNAPPVAAS
tara:strand:- start:430 stop:558 length:129 start_codon:yes stop_codon:yes gene_type:complete